LYNVEVFIILYHVIFKLSFYTKKILVMNFINYFFFSNCIILKFFIFTRAV